ncbi:MAG: CHASE3 domain-containing protein [Timaviella obliquedivisa GSE-PSE-MK23-08B]|jgi:signal transduction histidine kinase|nr:CHASE3 domain-containing protein [Timaviella obliquedivisa GSE-PSE-MK23-08B]
MKRSPEKKWLILGLGVIALVMGWISWMAYQSSERLLESTNKSQQTHEIIKNLINVYATMSIAESGRRGYVFLGDQKELYRYQAAIRELDPGMETLQKSLSDRLEQLKRLEALEILLNQRISLLQQSIQLYQTEAKVTPRQVQITEQSIKLRDKIQLVIAAMQQTEELSLEQWVDQSRTRIRQELGVSLLVISSSFGILAIASFLLYHQFVKRQQAEALQAKLMGEKEVSEAKLKFFSMVSHEFRTPLSVVLASSQLLTQGSQTWSEERKYKTLYRIQSSAKLMTRLLTDILALTRAEAGKLECHPEDLDLEAFCLNLVEEKQLSSTRSSIHFFSSGQTHPVRLDANLLYSILNNLLENAIKYSPPNQPVLLSSTLEPETVVFKVQDHGIGIALEEQQKIYELFYRGQNSGAIAGTGLGLAVVKKCVELHHGKIFVTSELGQGTTFTVQIPLTVADLQVNLGRNQALL